jgi:hypothetical protein
MPKPKSEAEMRTKQFTRVTFLDREAAAVLNKISELEGRSGTREYGMLLERLARIYKSDPEKLLDLGLISQHAMPARAVA